MVDIPGQKLDSTVITETAQKLPPPGSATYDNMPPVKLKKKSTPTPVLQKTESGNALATLAGFGLAICVVCFFYFLLIYQTSNPIGDTGYAFRDTDKEQERVIKIIGFGIGSGICLGMLLVFRKR